MADLESIIAGRMKEIAETIKSRPQNERDYQIYFNACSINLAYLTRSACLLKKSIESGRIAEFYDSKAKHYEAQGERLYRERKRLLEDKE